MEAGRSIPPHGAGPPPGGTTPPPPGGTTPPPGAPPGAPPPAGGPPAPVADDPLRPATLEELKSLRRWLWVTAAWALAASAIGVVAILKDDTPEGPDPNARVTALERRVDNRLDDLDERTQDLVPSADLETLEGRVQRVEQTSREKDETVDRTAAADRRRDQRIEALERQVDDLRQTIDDGSTSPDAANP